MNRNRGNLAYVDAMRGIAVLMVIMVHVSLRVPDMNQSLRAFTELGQFGVQLFFVASAFTLCRSFDQRVDEPLRLRAFVLRRIFRIAPLYYLAIPVYFVVNFLRDRAKGVSENLEQYTTVGVVANFAFIHGFVPEGNNTIVPGGWSIGTEMAFYAIFPLLVLSFKKLGVNTSSRMLGVVFLLFCANFAAQMAMGPETTYLVANSSFRYFNLLNQLPVFAVGFLAYYMYGDDYDVLHGRLVLATATSVACLIGCIYVWNADLRMKFVLLPMLFSFFFLFLMDLLRRLPLQGTLLCRIGQASYSMYIFHFLITLTVLPVVAPRIANWIPAWIAMLLYFVATVACTYVIASWTKRFVEDRGVRFGSALIRRLQGRRYPSVDVPDAGAR